MTSKATLRHNSIYRKTFSKAIAFLFLYLHIETQNPKIGLKHNFFKNFCLRVARKNDFKIVTSHTTNTSALACPGNKQVPKITAPSSSQHCDSIDLPHIRYCHLNVQIMILLSIA